MTRRTPASDRPLHRCAVDRGRPGGQHAGGVPARPRRCTPSGSRRRRALARRQRPKSDLRAYARRPPRRHASATSTNRRLTVFKRYFRWALRERLVGADPTLKLLARSQPLRVPKTLSEAQVEALLARARRGGRARRLPLPRREAARPAVPLPARERWTHAALSSGSGDAPSGSGRHSTTRRARRSTRARVSWASPATGGAEIDRLARRGTRRVSPSRSRVSQGSTSRSRGEDSASLACATSRREEAGPRADLAASYQHAIVRALVQKARDASAGPASSTSQSSVVSLRTPSSSRVSRGRFAPLELCTDNAAMIASQGRYAESLPYPGYLALDAYASF